MALSLAKAAPLKPGIRLAQALSEFEAILPDDQKTKLRTYRGQSPPNSTDVIRFTAEIDRDAGRNRRSRQCVGTRVTNVLNAVQQFATIVDFIVGSSQSQIAGAIWGTVKISLQLVSAISSYFDQLTTLFMTVGVSCPRYQDFELLYPGSTRLQSALCEYFIAIVHLCRKAVLFLKKPFLSQLSSSILKPFESEFGSARQNLENLAKTIREEVSLASNQAQQDEAKEMSKFRAFTKNFSGTLTRDIEGVRTWMRKRAELDFLNTCSRYNHESSWKQARKQGNTSWIFDDKIYKQWKEETVSSTLWLTGILGSGKTVLSANVVEDLKITTSAAVSYFFCRHDEAKSLETRTIIGSIARQIFDHVKSDIADAIADISPDTGMDTDQILKYLQELLPSTSRKYFVIIDGLDECKEKEKILLLQCLKELLLSKHVFQVYCSNRPDVSHWAHTLLKPHWNLSMPQTNADIGEYVKDTLVKHLESGSLCLGDSTIILRVQEALLRYAQGMFLWVAFQVDSICCQKTDEAILAALEDLPKNLPETFNRILRKLEHSTAADSQFCRKVFDLVAAAQRPLTLEELREAVSVQPGETSWDSSKLINDMLRSLLDSCGSLVTIDEERLTVHFTHHSVKQHLLSGPIESDLRKYHINMEEADLSLGDITVTYLNYGVFDRRLAKAKSPTPQVKAYPSAIAILGGNLPQSSITNKLAVKLLKSRGNCSLDIHSQFKTAAGIVDQTQPAHHFLPYAQEYWLFHTKAIKRAREARYSLWKRLIDDEVKTTELPWAPKNWRHLGEEYIEWIIQNEHWALIERSLFYVAELNFDMSRHDQTTSVLLELLTNKAADINTRNIHFDTALYLASRLNNKASVLLFLEKGADINAVGGIHGTALHAASEKGLEEMVRLLLENGANVNALGGNWGTALQVVSYSGNEQIARLLLEKGVNVNALDGYYGTALQAASVYGHEQIARLLRENGANVNALGGYYGTALQAASSSGHEQIARLLLENGANVNAEGGDLFDTALEAAAFFGHDMTVELLLKNGAIVNDKTMTAATDSSNRAVKSLIRKAWKSQSASEGDRRRSPEE